MKEVLDITFKANEKPYDKFTTLSKVVDRFKTRVKDDFFIEDLGIKILNAKLPNNFNKAAYYNNINSTRKIVKNPEVLLSPKGIRVFDYYLLNDFQKRLFSYGVVKSIQLVLRNKNKSIKNSTILIDDASDELVYYIIKEAAKHTRHMIFLSKDIKKSYKIRDYIIANFGVSPEITWDENYALKISDFIISTKENEYEYCDKVWYINNLYIPRKENCLAVNDVSFKVPWSFNQEDISPELLGAIFLAMDQKDVEKALSYNGITIDKIKFNQGTIEL